MRKLCFVLLVVAFEGCKPPNVKINSVNIGLSKDSETVVLHGLDHTVLQQLKQDSLSDEQFQDLFPVYRMPADTDAKNYQKAQPGKYFFTDSTITFKPDTIFQKDKTYFARFYGMPTENSPTNLAQGKVDLKKPKFTEATFKF